MKNKSKHLYNKIISEVINTYSITKKQLYSRSRTKSVVEPRQLAHYLLMLNRYTCVDIAKDFNMHYSTILHSRLQIENRFPYNYDFVVLVNYIESKLNLTQSKFT